MVGNATMEKSKKYHQSPKQSITKVKQSIQKVKQSIAKLKQSIKKAKHSITKVKKKHKKGQIKHQVNKKGFPERHLKVLPAPPAHPLVVAPNPPVELTLPVELKTFATK